MGNHPDSLASMIEKVQTLNARTRELHHEVIRLRRNCYTLKQANDDLIRIVEHIYEMTNPNGDPSEVRAILEDLRSSWDNNMLKVKGTDWKEDENGD